MVTISKYIAHFTLAAFFKFLHDDIEGSNLVSYQYVLNPTVGWVTLEDFL